MLQFMHYSLDDLIDAKCALKKRLKHKDHNSPFFENEKDWFLDDLREMERVIKINIQNKLL